jgi:hypothetical protein
MSTESNSVKEVVLQVSGIEYVIKRNKDGAINVLQDGESCDNVKNVLRTINQEKDLGFTDEQFKSSNTRSIGKQIMDLLEQAVDNGEEPDNVSSEDNSESGNNLLCHNCNSEIHYYWGDINSDTYRAYTIDKGGNRLDETEVLPSIDRADEIKDESYFMCSNGDCMWAWDTKEEMFNRGKD